MNRKQRLEEFKRINTERDEAERASEREYRDALWDYNDGIRNAYKKHHNNLDRIEKEWQEKLKAINTCA